MTAFRLPLRHLALAVLGALCALLLALAGTGSTPAHAASQNDAAKAGKAEKSIVYLDVTFEGAVKMPFTSGTETYTASVSGGCTGWFASSEAHIVTAAHCVEKSDDVRLAVLKKVLASLGYSEYLQQGWDENWAAVTGVTVRAYQPQGVDGAVPALQTTGLTAQLIDAQTFDNGDLALLKIADLDGTSPLTIASSSPGLGERVTAVGFAGSVTNVSDASRQRASFKTGTVSSRQVTTTGVPITEIDAAVTNGMSGGPTVDADGNAIGVNSFKIRGEAQAFNFVTDTEALTSFLSRNGVTPAAGPTPGAVTPAASATPGATGATGTAGAQANWFEANLALLITIGGLAVLVIGIGTALVVVLAKRRGPRGAEEPLLHQPVSQQPAFQQPLPQQPVLQQPAPAEPAEARREPQVPTA